MRLNEAQRSLVSNVRWGGGGKPEVPSGRVTLEPRWTAAVHLCFPDLFNTYRATSACHTLLQRFQHRTRQTDQAWTLELILQRKEFASLWESEQGRESEGERARTLQLLCWLSGNSVVNHGKKQPGLIKPAATHSGIQFLAVVSASACVFTAAVLGSFAHFYLWKNFFQKQSHQMMSQINPDVGLRFRVLWPGHQLWRSLYGTMQTMVSPSGLWGPRTFTSYLPITSFPDGL